MRRLILLASALLGISLVLTGCSSSGGSGAVSTVGAAEFVTAAAEPGTVVLDVRTPAEYAAGHVAGAVNLDVESGAFDAQIETLDKAATYAVYCRSGRRSAIAADAMDKAGFLSVVNLDGGIADLQAAGASIVG